MNKPAGLGACNPILGTFGPQLTFLERTHAQEKREKLRESEVSLPAGRWWHLCLCVLAQ